MKYPYNVSRYFISYTIEKSSTCVIYAYYGLWPFLYEKVVRIRAIEIWRNVSTTHGRTTPLKFRVGENWQITKTVYGIWGQNHFVFPSSTRPQPRLLDPVFLVVWYAFLRWLIHRCKPHLSFVQVVNCRCWKPPLVVRTLVTWRLT